MSIDKWLGKVYRHQDYTCSDFTREVMLDLTGRDIGKALAGLLRRHSGAGLTRAHVRLFRVLREPVDPCIVVMQAPRRPVHLAVYVAGSILQITERGVTFQPAHVATQFHKTFRYVQCTI